MKLFKVILVILLVYNITHPMQNTKQFNLINKKSYKILYDREFDAAEIQKFSHDLDSAFMYWKAKLSVKQKGKIEFIIYKSERSYKHKSGVKFNISVYRSRGIVHISPKAIEYRNKNYSSYLTQAVISGLLKDVNKKGCPEWLSDAFAFYISKLDEVETQGYIDTQLNIRDFQQEYSQLKREAQYRMFIVRAFSFLNYLETKYGGEKIYLLFRTFDGKRTDEEVFEIVFGEKFDAIEKGWRLFVRAKQK